MPKLHFKYGCMGSSKTANALMVKYNYEQQGYNVLLLKPSIDTRDGTDIIKSRIGLESKCITIKPDTNIINMLYFKSCLSIELPQVVIVDEAQFLTSLQVEQLHHLSKGIPIICYGLLTDFQTHLFEGSKRLIELSEDITEIKTICKCGNKAMFNARINKDGSVIKDGEQILIGGDDKYSAMCKFCYGKILDY